MPDRSPYGPLQRTLGSAFTPLGGKLARLGGRISLLGDANLNDDGSVRSAQPESASVLDTAATDAQSGIEPLAPVTPETGGGDGEGAAGAASDDGGSASGPGGSAGSPSGGGDDGSPGSF